MAKKSRSKTSEAPNEVAVPKVKNAQVTLHQVFQHWGALARRAEWAELHSQLTLTLNRLKQDGKAGELDEPDLLLNASQTLATAHPHSALLLAQAVLTPHEWIWNLPLTPAQVSRTWNLVAAMQDRLGDMKAAKAATLAVLEQIDAPPEHMIQAANLLVRYGGDAQAFEAAMRAYEALEKPLKHTATVLYIAQRVAHWPSVDALTAQLRQAYAEGRYDEVNESPRTNLLWCDDESVNIEVVKRWSQQVMPKVVNASPPVVSLDGRRIRIGYLSSDFRDHPTARLINGIYRHHDRQRFELFMYCSGWDDGSEMRKEVESHMDHVHSVAKLGDKAAADLIRSHGIDVLVELNGPTRANRMGILSHRPAPVQIDYLGWPGSVGGRVVDYVVGDPYTVPEGVEQKYPEKVIRLAGTYQINDHLSMKRQPVPSRQSVGLPEDPNVVVVGMFNAINKVHSEVWAVWMRILKAVPNALLWILNPGDLGRKHIAQVCLQHGVSPKRILAAPGVKQEEHLARLQCCDLMLDPWPYGGHTSTSDALFAAVPVVTLEGKNFAGRVSGGLLKAAGLAGLVMPDVESYVRTAVGLLRDPAQLQRIKAELMTRMDQSLTFNAALRTRQMEAAYEQTLRWAEAAEPARHLDVTAVRGTGKRRAVVAEKAQTEVSTEKTPLVLVCGPWSSGTSATAGFLAKAGLTAPGPYFAVNDPRTPETFEMQAFREVLNSIASEATLKRTHNREAVLQALRAFAAGPLKKAREAANLQAHQPVLLKHALPALFLPELAEVFDLKVVGVLRPLSEIEATRQRRRWGPMFGKSGAALIYSQMFQHLVETQVPFHLVRYSELLEKPSKVLAELAAFCELSVDEKAQAEAVAFMNRPVKTTDVRG